MTMEKLNEAVALLAQSMLVRGAEELSRLKTSTTELKSSGEHFSVSAHRSCVLDMVRLYRSPADELDPV